MAGWQATIEAPIAYGLRALHGDEKPDPWTQGLATLQTARFAQGF